MHIDQLQAFDRIVREGSFSRAAWTLGIAQPTISARIQALEQAVGGVLFTRTNQGVQLTPLGTSFLPYAQRALAMLTEGLTAAQLAQQGQHGRLAVGILGSLTDCLLAPVLAQLHQTHPLIEWYVRAGSHRQVVEHLCDGVVEVALIAWPTVHPPGAEFVPLLHIREPVVCVAPRDHPLATRETVSADDVAIWGAPFLLIRWWQVTPNWITRIAARAQLVANVPPETGVALAQDGLGIGFFTRTSIAAALNAGHVVEIPVTQTPPLSRDTALVRLDRNLALSPTAEAFVQVLRAYASRHHILHS
jgi:DNA-binding transcriptional LysR family regulator